MNFSLALELADHLEKRIRDGMQMCESDEKKVECKDTSYEQRLTQRIIRKYIEQTIQKTEVELKPRINNLETDGFTAIRIIMKAKLDHVKKERRSLVPMILSQESSETK